MFKHDIKWYQTVDHDLWNMSKSISPILEPWNSSYELNKILTCRAIFYHLEDSRSHGNEREGNRAWGQGARPPP